MDPDPRFYRAPKVILPKSEVSETREEEVEEGGTR